MITDLHIIFFILWKQQNKSILSKKLMQRFLLLFTFLFCVAVVKADCSGNGISCWPNTSTIKANPVFMITFYAYSQGIVAGLNTKNAIYLRSGEQ